MKTKPLLALTLAFACLVAVMPSAHAQDRNRRTSIIGGQAVPAGQYDAVAYVEIPGRGSCSGVAIRPLWILTAAHCFYDEFGRKFQYGVEVTVGQADLDSWFDGHSRSAAQIYTHAEYTSDGDPDVEFDLALIRLRTAVPVDHTLPLGSAPPNGTEVRALGYGLIDDGTEPGHLRTVTTTAFESSQPHCARGDVSICLSHYDGLGDSGGPLVWPVEGPGQQVVAITHGHESAGSYSVAANPGAVQAWIDQLIGDEAVVVQQVVRGSTFFHRTKWSDSGWANFAELQEHAKVLTETGTSPDIAAFNAYFHPNGKRTQQVVRGGVIYERERSVSSNWDAFQVKTDAAISGLFNPAQASITGYNWYDKSNNIAAGSGTSDRIIEQVVITTNSGVSTLHERELNSSGAAVTAFDEGAWIPVGTTSLNTFWHEGVGVLRQQVAQGERLWSRDTTSFDANGRPIWGHFHRTGSQLIRDTDPADSNAVAPINGFNARYFTD